MAETKIVYISMDKTLNNKELRFKGWDAVQASIYSLLTTPINSLPEMPSMGFDLDEFLFRAAGDPVLSDLEAELTKKLHTVCKNETISCSVTVESHTVFIKIEWEGDGVKRALPITIEEGTNGRVIKFKNITLR